MAFLAVAQFEVSTGEYAAFQSMGRRHGPWVGKLGWSLAVALLFGAVYAGQYWFGVLFGILLAFVYYSMYRMAPRMQLTRRSNNPYAHGPFQIEFFDDHYELRVGDTEMKLHLNEMGRVHDFNDHYRLDHKSGVCIHIPKRALSVDEGRLIEGYYERFTGMPKNQSEPDY